MLEAVHALFAVDSLDEFGATVLEELENLISFDLASFNEVDPTANRASFVSRPESMGMGRPEAAAWQRLAYQNPILDYFRRTGDGSARRMSDFITLDELHALELYREVYRTHRCRVSGGGWSAVPATAGRRYRSQPYASRFRRRRGGRSQYPSCPHRAGLPDHRDQNAGADSHRGNGGCAERRGQGHHRRRRRGAGAAHHWSCSRGARTPFRFVPDRTTADGYGRMARRGTDRLLGGRPRLG